MRRKDKEIIEYSEIEDVILRSEVCHLGLTDDGCPYVVAMNFGYDNRVIYFHCATEGKKLDIIRKNPRVCVEFDVDHQIVINNNACGCGMKFRSAVAFGQASIVVDYKEKIRALEIIMKNYSNKDWVIPDESLDRICIVKVMIEKISGKKSGY